MRYLIILWLTCAALVSTSRAQFSEWKHSSSIWILTTPEGADLPESAAVKDFPVLVRLHRDFFAFSDAAEDGTDIRFSYDGKPLAFEIEKWDADNGTASIWVRIPEILGNRRQEITIHWGNPDVESESRGKAVFNDSNGYISVFHLGDEVRDVAGALKSDDKGTSQTAGMIGDARRFPGGKGVFCGNDITTFPMGGEPHSTQAWFRSDSSRGRILSWGKEQAQGKVQMWYQSPPHIYVDCYFSNGNTRSAIPGRSQGWTHVVHTFHGGQARLYLNGRKVVDGNSRATPLNIERPAQMWIGGWYNNYDYQGDIDEVRISSVARSADWIRLEYENQKPNQSLVGMVVQPGDKFEATPKSFEVNEGAAVKFTATAEGALKTYWKQLGDDERVLAADRLRIRFKPERITQDTRIAILFEAVYPDGIRRDVLRVLVRNTLPEPAYVLKGPAEWDGRTPIEIRPEISNLQELESAGVDKLVYDWDVSGLATLNQPQTDSLVLHRAQNSGRMTVRLSLSNGGEPTVISKAIDVTEPESDPQIERTLNEEEMPVDGQFYARNDSGRGTLYCRGVLKEKADSVFIRVLADGKKFATKSASLAADGSYELAVKLDAALVKYFVEFGIAVGKQERVLHRASDIVCGDAYLIDGQSNALATDTREESPRDTNEWVRSYGRPRFFEEGGRENLWCKPVWKAQREHMAELGWWGMKLANQLVESQQVPVFMLNASVGGTRIDQHQRNEDDPTDLTTIYGRMLWRLQRAKLTHGIRAIIWHQGENDQGAAGPDGGYGWETYQKYFVSMSAAWKRDFPNVRRYYMFQIWPSACAMGRDGNGDMLREQQRILSRLYSNMEILSTLGIQPPGGCHFPLEGWGAFSDRVQRLIERDFYGANFDEPITAANLIGARYSDDKLRAIHLEFDQPVVWDDQLVSQFYLDDESGKIASALVKGNVVTLKLTEAGSYSRITYLKESSWNPKNLLRGENGMAALTFCNVAIKTWP